MSGWGDNDLKTQLSLLLSLCGKWGPNIPEQGANCLPSDGDENTCGSKCVLWVNPHCLSIREGEGRGQEGEVSPEVCPSTGASVAQHVGGSGLLVCHLMSGNPWYKATYFWSWKILLNFVASWPSISCQVLSHVPAIPKLGYSPLGYAT